MKCHYRIANRYCIRRDIPRTDKVRAAEIDKIPIPSVWSGLSSPRGRSWSGRGCYRRSEGEVSHSDPPVSRVYLPRAPTVYSPLLFGDKNRFCSELEGIASSYPSCTIMYFMLLRQRLASYSRMSPITLRSFATAFDSLDIGGKEDRPSRDLLRTCKCLASRCYR